MSGALTEATEPVVMRRTWTDPSARFWSATKRVIADNDDHRHLDNTSTHQNVLLQLSRVRWPIYASHNQTKQLVR